MINVENERLISFREACEVLPRRRAGKKPHISTLYRWSGRGSRGVKLEVVQVGGTLCTSVQALQRFLDELTMQSRPHTTQRRRNPTTSARLESAGLR